MLLASLQLISNIPGCFVVLPRLPIVSIVLSDFLMGSDTGNCVIFNHCYTLAHLQCAQTMGYHNDRLSLAEILNSFVNLHLIFRVRGACGLV